jgi:predicted Zn-dependent protease
MNHAPGKGMKLPVRFVIVFMLALTLAAACATSPTGRKQLTLVPESQMAAMGGQAFAQLRDETPAVTDRAIDAYVQCVARAIIEVPAVQHWSTDWEVVVFDDPAVNAFALPGGKIGVYQGMLAVAETPGQLAAVLGHEVGHVLARHGNERVSQNIAVGQTLALVEAWMAAGNRGHRETAMAALGLGAQVGVLLPFSRRHESEADEIGQELMARAGFDPNEAVALWQNMARAGGGGPEFLSTHPSHDTRIRDLRAGVERTSRYYREAQAAGRRPDCRPPA